MSKIIRKKLRIDPVPYGTNFLIKSAHYTKCRDFCFNVSFKHNFSSNNATRGQVMAASCIQRAFAFFSFFSGSLLGGIRLGANKQEILIAENPNSIFPNDPAVQNLLLYEKYIDTQNIAERIILSKLGLPYQNTFPSADYENYIQRTILNVGPSTQPTVVSNTRWTDVNDPFIKIYNSQVMRVGAGQYQTMNIPLYFFCPWFDRDDYLPPSFEIELQLKAPPTSTPVLGFFVQPYITGQKYVSNNDDTITSTFLSTTIGYYEYDFTNDMCAIIEQQMYEPKLTNCYRVYSYDSTSMSAHFIRKPTNKIVFQFPANTVWPHSMYVFPKVKSGVHNFVNSTVVSVDDDCKAGEAIDIVPYILRSLKIYNVFNNRDVIYSVELKDIYCEPVANVRSPLPISKDYKHLINDAERATKGLCENFYTNLSNSYRTTPFRVDLSDLITTENNSFYKNMPLSNFCMEIDMLVLPEMPGSQVYTVTSGVDFISILDSPISLLHIAFNTNVLSQIQKDLQLLISIKNSS